MERISCNAWIPGMTLGFADPLFPYAVCSIKVCHRSTLRTRSLHVFAAAEHKFPNSTGGTRWNLCHKTGTFAISSMSYKRIRLLRLARTIFVHQQSTVSMCLDGNRPRYGHSPLLLVQVRQQWPAMVPPSFPGCRERREPGGTSIYPPENPIPTRNKWTSFS